jgi:predicted ribonuclease toxin of YeeF-YezG toxin-antitoxin module
MLEMIAIESIIKTIKESNDINKILNDVNHQLELIKHN